jgi:hypothetical protein
MKRRNISEYSKKDIIEYTVNYIVNNELRFIKSIVNDKDSKIISHNGETLTFYLSRRKSLYDYENNSYTLIKNKSNIVKILKKIKIFQNLQIVEPFEKDPLYISYIENLSIELELERVLVSKLNNELDKKNHRYIILPIIFLCSYDLNQRNESLFTNIHSNIIIIDTKIKKWTIIEPHGEINKNTYKINSIQESIFKEYNYDEYEYLELSKVNEMNLNPILSNNNKPIQGNDELCCVWSLYMLYGIMNDNHNNIIFHKCDKYININKFIYNCYKSDYKYCSIFMENMKLKMNKGLIDHDIWISYDKIKM